MSYECCDKAESVAILPRCHFWGMALPELTEEVSSSSNPAWNSPEPHTLTNHLLYMSWHSTNGSFERVRYWWRVTCASQKGKSRSRDWEPLTTTLVYHVYDRRDNTATRLNTCGMDEGHMHWICLQHSCR